MPVGTDRYSMFIVILSVADDNSFQSTRKKPPASIEAGGPRQASTLAYFLATDRFRAFGDFVEVVGAVKVLASHPDRIDEFRVCPVRAVNG